MRLLIEEKDYGRFKLFEEAFKSHLEKIRYVIHNEQRKEPKIYGILSLRSILSLREQCLQEFDFNDIYSSVKNSENTEAIDSLSQVLVELNEQEPSSTSLMTLIIDNILAGNMFDWGHENIHDMLRNKTFSFSHAREAYGRNLPFYAQNKSSPYYNLPLLIQEFSTRISTQSMYKCAFIFVDNSGADVVLGILPFARFLLQHGTRVMLLANSDPSINDITVFYYVIYRHKN